MTISCGVRLTAENSSSMELSMTQPQRTRTDSGHSISIMKSGTVGSCGVISEQMRKKKIKANLPYINPLTYNLGSKILGQNCTSWRSVRFLLFSHTVYSLLQI